MIISEFVEVTIINHNFHHYKNLGYDVKCRQKIMVKTEELSAGSHCIITCSCDDCGNETNIRYQDYLKIFNKNNKYVCQKCRHENFGDLNSTIKDIMKKGRLSSTKEKYGVDNVFQLKFVKDKMKNTFLEKYGFDSPMKNPDVQEKLKLDRIKNGKQIPDELLSDFQKYKKIVHYYTRKEKKNLYNNWNGLDYYDSELIIENKKIFNSNDERYLTIDHKISIKKGFENKIEPIIIGSMANLCITKRCNNSSKGSLYETPKRLKN